MPLCFFVQNVKLRTAKLAVVVSPEGATAVRRDTLALFIMTA